MALPIAPTPVLRGKEANRFLAEVKKNEKIPAKMSPAPNFQEIKKIAIEKWGKKHN
jgi:hypothetical protein